MALTVITAPAGSGKTQSVIDRIWRLGEVQALPRILVILPSGMQVSAFRERLGYRPRVSFGTTLSDFHSLYRDILDNAGTLPRLLPEAARYRLIRHVIHRLADGGRLPYFAPIADKPGLHNAIARFIAELKENLTLPDAFARLASTPRVRDLASIYAEYQHLLQEQGLADREGMGWLARAALSSNPQLYADFDYVAADGFDEFNPTQLAILHLLAARVPRLDITLTFQPNRLAHTRFERTLAGFPDAKVTGLLSPAPPRVAALDHLEKHLFEWNAPRTRVHESIRLIRAPTREREVREIARAIKQLLLDTHRPDQMIVLFRNLDPYQAIVREIFTEFGIPFRVRSGIPLQSNPLISALANLFAISVDDFPWRPTLDAFRSCYFEVPLSKTAVADIERITREAVVVQGRQAWLDAFVKPTAPLREDEADRRRVTELSEQEIVALRAGVQEFFQRVTLPAQGHLRDFVGFIERLIGPDPADEEWQAEQEGATFQKETESFRVIEHAGQGTPNLHARDLAALVEFKDVLRGLIQAEDILREPETRWEIFLADLLDAIRAATYDLSPATDGRVVVATVTQARGVPRDFVFLGGLLESEFPSRAPVDPLLSRAERDSLRLGGVPLADLKVRDETTLFYEAVSLARRQLYLSHPFLDDNANPLYPSPYLESVQALFGDLSPDEVRLQDTPSPEQAASLQELAVSLIRTPSPQIDQALREISPEWRHSLFARQIETGRESTHPCDEYSGVLHDADLCAEMAERFGSRYVWSASQFNQWGSCGFRFFAARLLNLEDTGDPELGLDPLQLGGLYHEILEETYKEFARLKMAVTPATLERARGILHSKAGPIIENAPTRFAFRPTAWWKQEGLEILRRLDALLAIEADGNTEDASVPAACEVSFGIDQTPPLVVNLPEGKIRVRGKIDRLDRSRDGVVLIDYKTGSSPIGPQEVIEGRNLQLPVYVLAAQALKHNVSDAFYLHIRTGKKSGAYSGTDMEGWLAAAKEHMNRFVTLARSGAFAVVPAVYENGACTAYCEFSALCRVGHWSRHKGSVTPDA